MLMKRKFAEPLDLAMHKDVKDGIELLQVPIAVASIPESVAPRVIDDESADYL